MTLDELKPFCGQLSRKLDKPFRFKNQTCATDGRILLAVPAIAGDGPPPDLGTQNVLALIPPAHECTESVELPRGWQDYQLCTRPCDNCKGHGYFEECADCNGRGEKTCGECGESRNCPMCEASGYFATSDKTENPCMDCDGEGNGPQITPVICNDHRGVPAFAMDHKYLRLIFTLPNPRLSRAMGSYCTRIDFDGGSGVLMNLSGSVLESRDDATPLHQ